MRVVRSAKDKAWDEMKDKVGKINNALKINDWTIVEGEFDELSKRIEAKKALLASNGQGVPRFYTKLLATLEDKLNEIKEKVGARDGWPGSAAGIWVYTVEWDGMVLKGWHLLLSTDQAKEGTAKKMSPGNERSFKRMKNKLNKAAKAQEAELAKYREDPSAFMADEKDMGEEAAAPDSDDESTSSSSSSASSSSSSSSSSGSSSSDSDSDSVRCFPMSHASPCSCLRSSSRATHSYAHCPPPLARAHTHTPQSSSDSDSDSSSSSSSRPVARRKKKNKVRDVTPPPSSSAPAFGSCLESAWL